MSFRRWLNLFIFNLFQLTVSILVVFLVIIYGLDIGHWSDILTFQVIKIPLYTWLIAFVIVVSAIIASILTYNTGRDYDAIRAKINWLLLNKAIRFLNRLKKMGNQITQRHWTKKLRLYA